MAVTLDEMFNTASKVWVPNWFKLFSDNENGGFHERLGNDGVPLDMPKRLLTQCRQVIVYSLASLDAPDNQAYIDKLHEGFDFIVENYHVKETGGAIFSINADKTVSDNKYDLYGHAFALLGSAAYYNATKNPEALTFAKDTFNFIKERFTLSNEPGLAEALDEDLNPIETMRRQNPHMHLMEASIYMYEASGDRDYLDMADEMLELFYDKLLDKDTHTIGEFFEDDLTPHKEHGNAVEAGHHAEWVWLLKRYQEVSGSTDPRLDDTMKKLFTWVVDNGIDPEHGGVFNEQTRDGAVTNSSKRIWPALETIRAASIMANDAEYEQAAKQIVAELSAVLTSNYIDMNTGEWNEILDRKFSPETDYRPGTTPYHIFPVLRESAGYMPKQ